MYMLANFNPLSCTSAQKAFVGITTEYRANFLCTFIGAAQLLTSEIKQHYHSSGVVAWYFVPPSNFSFTCYKMALEVEGFDDQGWTN